MARKKRDYKLEYAKRNRKAIDDGYPSYGVKRRMLRQKRLMELLVGEEVQDIRDYVMSPEDTYKRSRLDILKDKGLSQQDIDMLWEERDEPDFWRSFRERYDKLVTG